MANRFVAKLFGSSAPQTPEVQEALAELAKLAQKRKEIAGSITLMTDILPSMYAKPIHEAPPSLTAEHAAAKLASRMPLLRGENVTLDAKGFKQRWQVICAAMERHQESQAANHVARNLRQGKLDADDLARDLLGGRAEKIYARANELDLDAGTLASVLRLTLFPVLAHLNNLLLPLRHNQRWDHGYCPTCGSWPLLGEFRGLEQIRFLRCGLCASEWEFPRLLCPFCGTRNHHVLGYLHVEGEETKYRAATCDTCRGYVKVLSSLTALPAPQLLVAELATMHLDLAAAERGYTAQP